MLAGMVKKVRNAVDRRAKINGAVAEMNSVYGTALTEMDLQKILSPL